MSKNKRRRAKRKLKLSPIKVNTLANLLWILVGVVLLIFLTAKGHQIVERISNMNDIINSEQTNQVDLDDHSATKKQEGTSEKDSDNE